MKLLDTAVLVDIDRGNYPQRVHRLDEEGRHAISLVSVTEMRTGLEIQYESDGEEYRDAVEKLDRFLSRFDTVPLNRFIAVSAAEIIADLKAEGELVNDLHDIYIGATARTKELPVLTPNTSHFERIPGVEVRDWEEY